MVLGVGRELNQGRQKAKRNVECELGNGQLVAALTGTVSVQGRAKYQNKMPYRQQMTRDQ